MGTRPRPFAQVFPGSVPAGPLTLWRGGSSRKVQEEGGPQWLPQKGALSRVLVDKRPQLGEAAALTWAGCRQGRAWRLGFQGRGLGRHCSTGGTGSRGELGEVASCPGASPAARHFSTAGEAPRPGSQRLHWRPGPCPHPQPRLGQSLGCPEWASRRETWEELESRCTGRIPPLPGRSASSCEGLWLAG